MLEFSFSNSIKVLVSSLDTPLEPQKNVFYKERIISYDSNESINRFILTGRFFFLMRVFRKYASNFILCHNKIQQSLNQRDSTRIKAVLLHVATFVWFPGLCIFSWTPQQYIPTSVNRDCALNPHPRRNKFNNLQQVDIRSYYYGINWMCYNEHKLQCWCQHFKVRQYNQIQYYIKSTVSSTQ